MKSASFIVVLVEDSPAEAKLARLALNERHPDCTMICLKDGEEVLSYLHHEHPFEDAEAPDLVLLDNSLAKLSGLEVVEHIKLDEHLKRIPVLLFSSSEFEDYINSSYEHYANSYIVKPGEFERFVQVLSDIIHYWKNVVRRPSKDHIYMHDAITAIKHVEQHQAPPGKASDH